MGGVILWAHQGGAKESPSNTLEAMKVALALPAGKHELGLECDIHLTADGQLAVIHDRTLERTTNGRGRVRYQPYGSVHPARIGIRNAHAAWWWRPGVIDDHESGPYPERVRTDDDIRVPILTQILDLDRPVKLTIEIKSKKAATSLALLLRERNHEDVGLVITSFATRYVRRFRRAMGEHAKQVELAPGLGYLIWLKVRVGLGWLPRQTMYARIQIPRRILKITWATPRFVSAIQGVKVKGRTLDDGSPQRVAVDVWTIDDEATVLGLLDLGVDGLMTDTPERLIAVVAGRQAGVSDSRRMRPTQRIPRPRHPRHLG